MTAGAIFTAIVALVQAIPIVDSWFRQLIAAWIDKQAQETLSAISDAAALAARATTDDERYAASVAWQKALQRPRQGS